MVDDIRTKYAVERRKRELQASDAAKAWAGHVVEIERTRRIARLRDRRLAREAAAAPRTPRNGRYR
jgi:hypothetical protein